MYRPETLRPSPSFALAARAAGFLAVTGLIAAGLLAIAGALPAQETSADPMARATAVLQFRTIGPTIMGGRVSDLAVVESDPRIFYVGVATGGVWKTENAGITFTHVFKDEATASVGDVTVAPSNPNVVWVGTGEPQNRQSSPWGNGVYRSTDAGRTWTHVGLSNTHHISRIQVHPRDPDVAYVAAVGHLWGPNPERGVYRTTDGGESWERVLHVDDDTGAIDLVMDPADPRTLFAAMYQRRRRAWGFNGGGPGSGIYRTTDGGNEWAEVTEGLPEGDKGRIGLDIYRGDGNMVFALVEADARVPGQGFGGGGGGGGQNGVYRSTDRGESWEQVSTTNKPSHVLQPSPGGPQRPGADLPGRLQPLPVLGRGAELHPRRRGRCPLGPPCPLDRPRRLGPPGPGRRRRSFGELGPLRQLVSTAEPAHRPVLRDRGRHAGPLPRLRRPSGQRFLVRALRHLVQPGDPHARLVQCGIRRRLLHGHAPRQPGPDVRRVSGREYHAGEPRDRRAGPHPPPAPPGRRRRGARTALELGLAGHAFSP